MYKIPIDAGFTCPNRDGKLDTRGCIFCSSFGSGDFVQGKSEKIESQIQKGISYISDKFETKEKGRYIAYFQAFTNTYASVDVLREKYYEALMCEDVGIISIATRPDCLGEDVLGLLKEINKIKPVWVELGLQTIKPSSVNYIRRCYENEVYEKAIIDLYNIGISQIITHIILGLPNETKEDMVKTTKYVTDIVSNNRFEKERFGFKFQLLHILKNTDLLDDFKNGTFSELSLQKYIDILCECLEVLNGEYIVHRLTGDGDKNILVAPMWSSNKKHVLNEINKYIEDIGSK